MTAAIVLCAGAAVSAARVEAVPPRSCVAETVEAIVGEAVDARSIRLQDGRVLRLAGIEPFDLLRPEADRAEEELKGRLGKLVEAGGAIRVRLVSEKPDRYGRLPALVLAGETLVQERAAREGLAVAFATGDALPCFDRILAAEAEARRAHRGFWKDERLPWAVPSALAAQIGRFAIFEGKVLSVGNRPNRSYLNFGTWWATDVTVEIAAGNRDSFGGEAGLSALVERRVRVRGFLEEGNGPRMVLSSPMQLEILDALVHETGDAEAAAP